MNEFYFEERLLYSDEKRAQARKIPRSNPANIDNSILLSNRRDAFSDTKANAHNIRCKNEIFLELLMVG